LKDLVDVFESNERDFYYHDTTTDDVRLREFECPNCEYVFEVESRSITKCLECNEMIDNDGNIIEDWGE